MTTTIHTILEEFRQDAIHKRDLGDKFERLMVAFLKSDPIWKDLFSNVWLWSDFPKRGNAPDTGIDLVAEESATGDYWAIQCKFYDPNHNLEKSDIDSFLSTSGNKIFKEKMLISTTDKWGKNVEDTLNNQNVRRLLVRDLAESPVDWASFSRKTQALKLTAKKQIRPHQKTALDRVINGFKDADRGKLIMACGTGKTYTALQIAEQMAIANGSANVLFLVPSISLLSQTLREWSSEATVSLHSLAVCSDVKVSKKSENDDISTRDLCFPATTDADTIAARVKAFAGKCQLTVIFSTYQSIQAIADAQKKGLPEFDLIACDEAHRTTGVTLQGDDESHFVKVHNQDFIKAKKRLYMTATPKLFNDSTKTQAQDNEAMLCSMDDESLYGQEFHRLGFGEAVSNGLLTDYKVMVLAVSEKYISKAFQRQIADSNNELNLEDAAKITGCWNGLSKQMGMDEDGEDIQLNGDVAPMRRAVAFAKSIKDSQRIKTLFADVVEQLRQSDPNSDENFLHCEVEHVDGTENSLSRNKKLDWLKADTRDRGNVCRILSNARCLSEGVDVPSLDSVIFLTPRNSVVDVVQSVGRVMRKSEGKQYGYIILPIGIPADMTPEEALKDNQKYKVVWQVLQALRAHDDRFNATVNKIELNKYAPKQVQIIGVGGGGEGDEQGTGADGKPKAVQMQFNFPHLDEWREAIYAKIVVKCGDRRYWEDWAKDVAVIADRHTTRIKALLDDPELQHREAFNGFLQGLRSNVNPSVSESDAIEMLSQHLITKPVFDALFEGYQFTQKNPVSVAMQKMLDLLEGQSLEKETKKLDKFYASVRDRASGIDNAEGRQKVVIELYDKFFRNAFPKMAERLGIVYTPIEVVDFIIKSADDALKQEFGVGLTDENVHVLDPFTGTGSFIVRLLQSGLIKPEDLERKFKHELHANEIILLAYYIAAVNIEGAFHSTIDGDYLPFDGIVLTDTFQMFEGEGTLDNLMFPENNERVNRQKQNDIRVIIGNPPYSGKQDSTNDDNQNIKYTDLDKKIEDTYAKYSKATLKNKLYASEIRALKWASERIIKKEDKGIICYVINGAFIDANYADGLRKCFTEEFTSIYCFNLRGNQRTSGETSRMEGGKIFGAGSRAGIAIVMLIKNPNKIGECNLFYHDIGDCLSREDKLKTIANFGSISTIQWVKLTQNNSYDWINQRDSDFDKFISLGDKQDKNSKTIFDFYSNGATTSRDPWVYNFSPNNLKSNMSMMISFYNQQALAYKQICETSEAKQLVDPEKIISKDKKYISWSVNLKRDVLKGAIYSYDEESIRKCSYRPYCKSWLYFNKNFNERTGKAEQLFPADVLENLVIAVTGVGAQKDFSALVFTNIPDRHLHHNGQYFPLYSYEKQEKTDQIALLPTNEDYVKKENISDEIMNDFTQIYKGQQIAKEDIFY